MRSRELARALIVAGWLAGLVLIATGQPFPAAAAAPVCAIGAAAALWRGGDRLRSVLQARTRKALEKLPGLPGAIRRPKTRGTIERA